MTDELLLAVRRRSCGCPVAAALAGSRGAAELGRVYGRDRNHRLVWRDTSEITLPAMRSRRRAPPPARHKTISGDRRMKIGNPDTAQQIARAEAGLRARQHRLQREPFPGVDRDGMPRDLLAAEQSTWRRVSPRRNPWPVIVDFDRRADDLDRRRGEVMTALAELRAKLQAAPAADAQRLGEWIAAGEKGARPQPTSPELEAEVQRRQAEYEALEQASAKILAEKAEYVAKHRERLVSEAADRVHHQRLRCLALLTELRSARSDLAELRQAEVWASVYPSETARGQIPGEALVCGGLRQPVEATLGLQTRVEIEGVWRALTEDVGWLASAATPEQKAIIAGTNPADAVDPRAKWGIDTAGIDPAIQTWLENK